MAWFIFGGMVMQGWKASDRRALSILSALELPDDKRISSEALRNERMEASVQRWVNLKSTCLPELKVSQVAERFPFRARIMMRSGGRVIKGFMVNMSQSGAFLHINDEVFALNEKVALKIKPLGVGRTYDVIAEVVRFNGDHRHPTGYGIRFCWPQQMQMAG
jgi:hypothetical protein